MKQRIIIALILFLSSHFIHANEYWKQDYSKIDSFAVTVKRTTNINKLATKLTRNYTTDLEKYRSIFTWIAHNISYDCEALKNSTLRETDPIKVIKNRKAVCAGYSNLFQRLCESANLQCATINGWSNYKEDIGRPLSNNPNHSWNAIKINNEWYLCDVTWGAGSTSEDNGLFTFEFKDYYFCTPPLLFSYNHLPEDNQWLLGTELSRQEFINSPHFYPEAINFNIRDLNLNTGILNYKKNDTLEFKFTVDSDVRRISIKSSNSKKSTEINFNMEDNRIKFNYTLDSYSPYLYIYLNNNAIIVYKIKK